MLFENFHDILCFINNNNDQTAYPPQAAASIHPHKVMINQKKGQPENKPRSVREQDDHKTGRYRSENEALNCTWQHLHSNNNNNNNNIHLGMHNIKDNQISE